MYSCKFGASVGRRKFRNLLFHHLDPSPSNAQFSTKDHKAYKEIGNLDNSNEHNKSPESNVKEVETVEYLDKDFKMTVLNVPKELKQNMDR